MLKRNLQARPTRIDRVLRFATTGPHQLVILFVLVPPVLVLSGLLSPPMDIAMSSLRCRVLRLMVLTLVFGNLSVWIISRCVTLMKRFGLLRLL